MSRSTKLPRTALHEPEWEGKTFVTCFVQPRGYRETQRVLDERRRVNAYAKHLGLRIVWGVDYLPSGVTYAAGKIAAAIAPLEGALHDIAHWLVAPKSRRWRRNFGLGPLDAETALVKARVTEDYANREEELATTLHDVLRWALGYDESRPSLDDDDATELTRRGLLYRGHPAGMARIPRSCRRKPALVPDVPPRSLHSGGWCWDGDLGRCERPGLQSSVCRPGEPLRGPT